MPAAVRNVAREKLEQGQLSLGVGVRMTRSVEIAKAMAVAGFDWLFLDMEHGVMSLEACAQISTAALDAGIAPIARAGQPRADRPQPGGPAGVHDADRLSARPAGLCRGSDNPAQARRGRCPMEHAMAGGPRGQGRGRDGVTDVLEIAGT